MEWITTSNSLERSLMPTVATNEYNKHHRCSLKDVVLLKIFHLITDEDLEALEKTVEPTWPKLVESLEKIIDRLTVVWGAMNHLKSVKDNPELRSAIE
ncbi:hypothetical protein K7X08_033658 [Anisodus acutangulus]|uniref:Oligopeptidase A N-terminal domain-containing protein n=1 Tax=Anisodus acutangulus TaxID=402998 RepID=A0A9Q1M4J9_9SOLA|nr:hypothetical protein K7X08_033658 [Anisodus acutangulus]